MPVAMKSAGVWKPAVTGKVAVLTGSGPGIHEGIKAAGPVNWWPIRDPVGVNTCQDVIGTKDTTYGWFYGATQPPHPNPFHIDPGNFFPIPGGNPVKTFVSTGFTIEMMFKVPASWGGSLFGYQSTPAGVTPESGYVPSIYIDMNGQLRGAFYPLAQIVGPVVSDGKYHHVALTWSPVDQTQRMYVDGVPVGSSTGVPRLGQDSAPFDVSFNTYAQIGASYSTGGWAAHANSGWWLFEGDIYNVAVYNRALSASELATRKPPNWNFVAGVAIKNGSVGSGSWRDSGYVGIPGTPPAPYVGAWNYYNVQTYWDAPVGGAPVAEYEAQLRDSGGGIVWTGLTTPAGSRSAYWASLNPGWQYMARTRAKSVGGIWSPWSADLRFQMGRAEYYIPHSEYRTRPWYNARGNDATGQDGWLVVNSVDTVQTTWLQVNVALVNGSTPFSGSGAGRKANWLINNADGGYVGFKNSPWDEGVGWSTAWTSAWQGIWLTGYGWSANGGWLGYGTIHLWGTETYLYSWTETVPAIPNGYW